MVGNLRLFDLPMVEAIIDERRPRTHEKGNAMARALGPKSDTWVKYIMSSESIRNKSSFRGIAQNTITNGVKKYKKKKKLNIHGYLQEGGHID